MGGLGKSFIKISVNPEVRLGISRGTLLSFLFICSMFYLAPLNIYGISDGGLSDKIGCLSCETAQIPYRTTNFPAELGNSKGRYSEKKKTVIWEMPIRDWIFFQGCFVELFQE